MRAWLLPVAAVVLSACPAVARDQIQISGSSTVLPYATIVAEAFGENSGFPTPVVEGGGSGAGRKKLCEGQGEATLDIANSSSRIKPSDIANCTANGVTTLMEVRIGYDGIVFATKLGTPAFALSLSDLWLGLAEKVPAGGTFVPNPAQTWDQVNAQLPHLPINVFVPGTKHGSREVFDVKVLEAGCEAAGAMAAFAAAASGTEDEKKKAALEACHGLRADGASVDIDGDYSETLARLNANPNAMGVFGLSFYENNTDKLQVAQINGVMPSVASIASGEYAVSRPLYFYVKPAHFALVPGLKDYVRYFVSDAVAGPGGLLAGYGLVPDPDLAATQAAIEAETPLQLEGEPGAAVAAAAAPAAAPAQPEAAKPAETSAETSADPAKAPSGYGRLLLGLGLLLAMAAAFVLGRARATGFRAGQDGALHSVPLYHGALTLLAFALPAGLGLAAHALMGRPMGTSGAALASALPGLSGFALAYFQLSPALRARTQVERVVMAALIGCSLIAVLTTAGIVASLVVETFHFFQLYPAQDFFLSTTWTPKFGGGSQLGIWPLLWGTLYVSAIALLVAVPVGLMSAIYLAEYASHRVRSWVKPAIEILAGIPTIVYGLFALITVGPLLRDYLAQPLGLGDSSSSVMTAGLVMGIMVIPFVSSLSDDIINAVPQSLRDGSLGLGATPSETIRQVVIPAALPGIVGAVLLAASRAIGETMIVVMGAGASAQLSLNPFEAMTTVTVKIVSQLTGDTEFASPETLVAFALGLTLFVLTLGLNILALVIVRKYREQYE